MTKPCGRPTLDGPCAWRRLKGKQRCVWHWLLGQPIETQIAWARSRRAQAEGPERSRVPATEWPAGQRWCSGCQAMVPLFYCSGSRCKAHASEASHGSRIQSLYDITRDDYEALLRWQGGRCYICRRQPRTLRLVVDHDHWTGEVRGLLCGNNENGCNRGVVANLEAAVDGGLEAARRAVAYLERSPLARMRAGEARPDVLGVQERPSGPPSQPPPF